VTIYSDEKQKNTYWWCCRRKRTAWKPTPRQPKHRGEVHREITPSDATETPQHVFNTEDTKTMTEMEKQLLSALESLQTSYEQQQQAWQDSYSSLQHMFETTSQALSAATGCVST
jgi:hypothetical protein